LSLVAMAKPMMHATTRAMTTRMALGFIIEVLWSSLGGFLVVDTIRPWGLLVHYLLEVYQPISSRPGAQGYCPSTLEPRAWASALEAQAPSLPTSSLTVASLDLTSRALACL
jgi:hypothetical protein